MGEWAITAAWAFVVDYNLLLNRFRTAWAIGEDPHQAWSKSTPEELTSDSLLLLSILAIVAVFYVFVPVRCKIGWWIAFLAVIPYALVSFPLPANGPEGTALRRSHLVLALAMSCWLSLFGQARQEVLERQQFLALRDARAEVIHERVKRYEAEFEAQRSAMPDRKANGPVQFDNKSQVESATATEMVFESGDQVQLLALGLKEHWVLNGMSFSIDPDRVLGSGAFGVVRAGELCGVRVAVKLPRQPQSLGDILDRNTTLSNEVRILRRIRHPNIACFFGVYLAKAADGRNKVAILLEEVQGSPLREFIEEAHRYLNPVDRQHMLLDVGSALWYLHEHEPQIVHSDLKASNVLVESIRNTYRAKLIDFGLSRVFSRHAKVMGGSLAWMAPECFLKAQLVPAPTLDIFSFGRLAFFMVMGKRPCNASRGEIKMMAANGLVPALPWPELGAEKFFEECKHLCDRCLLFDPASRPSMAEVHREIAAWQVGTLVAL